jgi:CRISPR-associated protein Cas5t
MRVLKVEIDGVTTSFRHPHFLTGRQPTYPLPPPATIFGHIASALGVYPNPDAIRFAYSFTCAGQVDDMENIYLLSIGRSVPREAKAFFWPHAVNVSAAMNPVLRQVLFQPHLTLYLDAPGILDDLYEAFRSPKYMVVLGRSQDLASYRSVQVIESEEAESGYLEGTLLAHSERDRMRNVVTMMMPRYIDPNNRRQVLWSPYLLLVRHSFVVPQDVVQQEGGSAFVPVRDGERFDIDPTSPVKRGGMYRILYWHSFVPDGEVSIAVGTDTY